MRVLLFLWMLVGNNSGHEQKTINSGSVDEFELKSGEIITTDGKVRNQNDITISSSKLAGGMIPKYVKVTSSPTHEDVSQMTKNTDTTELKERTTELKDNTPEVNQRESTTGPEKYDHISLSKTDETTQLNEHDDTMELRKRDLTQELNEQDDGSEVKTKLNNSDDTTSLTKGAEWEGPTKHPLFAATTEIPIMSTPSCTPACTFGAECVSNSTGNPICQCLKCNETLSTALAVVGNDGNYYGNECWMKYAACQTGKELHANCFSSDKNCTGRCQAPVSACTCYSNTLECDSKSNAEFFPVSPYKTITTYKFRGTSIRKHLNSSSLRGLQHLEILDLGGIQILLFGEIEYIVNSIEELPDGIFSSLSSLRTLNLSMNFIEELPDGIFSRLSSLRTLFN